MATATASIVGPHSFRNSRQRLTFSVVLSVVAHALIIAMFAGLLDPLPEPVAGRVAQPLPIEVALVGVRPIAFAAPPEAPPQATETALPPQAVGTASSAPSAPTSPTQTSPPVIKRPFGVSVQTSANEESVSADTPLPRGDTAVGIALDTERLGHAQSMRLAQRYPRNVEKRPRLIGTMVVPYPPRAARARADARIGVLMLLDATGKVTDTTLFPDEPMFGPAVLSALKDVRFEPAQIDGKAVAYWVMLEFLFTMRPTVAAQTRGIDAAQSAPAPPPRFGTQP